MRSLELLAPARDKEIGIAAIDCGADAVYIGGPDFGARKAAGNSVEDIAGLCDYAHRFGTRVFVTFNTTISDGELESAHSQMRLAQDAGADAFIIRDTRVCGWEDITVPLHASTQCAIRDEERARLFEKAGCSRIILERELSLEQIRRICAAVSCEVEFFVHGALCVCYSGICRLSEEIDGRSADKGECIQACRSLYDLIDGDGNVLVHNKALLSLKDYNLKDRLEELAEAGVCSFKIEGRLKNASYVKNVVREYDLALNALVDKHPDLYCRASFGKVRGGFRPDSARTFNRGYTQLFLDGKRGKWSSMDAPKSMGERIGTVGRISRRKDHTMEITLTPSVKGLVLGNGDGFAFVTKNGVTGFRGDVCEGLRIRCKDIPALKEGDTLYRNLSAGFEKEIETRPCRREIDVRLDLKIHGDYVIDIHALTEDGRTLESRFSADVEAADNKERALAMLRDQLSKHSGVYSFRVGEIDMEGGSVPLLSASVINAMRRLSASDLDDIPVKARPLDNRERNGFSPEPATAAEGELMRSRYCIRYELGLCPKHQGAANCGPLFLSNNGRVFSLGFDCAACEMTVSEVRK